MSQFEAKIQQVGPAFRVALSRNGVIRRLYQPKPSSKEAWEAAEKIAEDAVVSAHEELEKASHNLAVAKSFLEAVIKGRYPG